MFSDTLFCLHMCGMYSCTPNSHGLRKFIFEPQNFNSLLKVLLVPLFTKASLILFARTYKQSEVDILARAKKYHQKQNENKKRKKEKKENNIEFIHV